MATALKVWRGDSFPPFIDAEGHCFGCDSPPVAVGALSLMRVCDVRDLRGEWCRVLLCPDCCAHLESDDTGLLERLRTRADDVLVAGNCRACGTTEGGTHAPWCERRDGTPTFTPAQVQQYRERRALGALDALETTLLDPLTDALRRDFGRVATYGNTEDGFWVEMAAGDVLTFRATDDGLVVLARPIVRGRVPLSVVRGN